MSREIVACEVSMATGQSGGRLGGRGISAGSASGISTGTRMCHVGKCEGSGYDPGTPEVVLSIFHLLRLYKFLPQID